MKKTISNQTAVYQTIVAEFIDTLRRAVDAPDATQSCKIIADWHDANMHEESCPVVLLNFAAAISRKWDKCPLSDMMVDIYAAILKLDENEVKDPVARGYVKRYLELGMQIEAIDQEIQDIVSDN